MINTRRTITDRCWFSVSIGNDVGTLDEGNAIAGQQPTAQTVESQSAMITPVDTNNLNNVYYNNCVYNKLRKKCTCGSYVIPFNSLTADQRKCIDFMAYMTRNVQYRSAMVVIDGGPGCGKSATLNYIMKTMRHEFNIVRLMTEKLVNIESHAEQLCEAHVLPHAGIHSERYTDANKLRESIMTCSVSKLIYDVMGDRKTDSVSERDRRRVDNEKINSVDAYRSELECIVDYYAAACKKKTLPSRPGDVNLYIIDEYAMISHEKLYFIIGFLMRRDPDAVNLFILSGDVDQVEPIGHENLNRRADSADYDKPWFELGTCDDVRVVYESLVSASSGIHVFEKFVLTVPARCAGDPDMTNFIQTYKTSESKPDVLDTFVSSLAAVSQTDAKEPAGNDVIVAHIPSSRVDDYVSGTVPVIDVGLKIIVRQNSEIKRISESIFAEFCAKYPELVVRTRDNDLITGMPYVLLKTLDSKKILCNRSVVALKAVNKTQSGAIDTITVCKLSDANVTYNIGPVYNDQGRPWFPLQLACVENSFQIQGMTLACDIYLDFYNCGLQHRYVMLTRAKSKHQIKKIINV